MSDLTSSLRKGQEPNARIRKATLNDLVDNVKEPRHVLNFLDNRISGIQLSKLLGGSTSMLLYVPCSLLVL